MLNNDNITKVYHNIIQECKRDSLLSRMAHRMESGLVINDFRNHHYYSSNCTYLELKALQGFKSRVQPARSINMLFKHSTKSSSINLPSDIVKMISTYVEEDPFEYKEYYLSFKEQCLSQEEAFRKFNNNLSIAVKTIKQVISTKEKAALNQLFIALSIPTVALIVGLTIDTFMPEMFPMSPTIPLVIVGVSAASWILSNKQDHNSENAIIINTIIKEAASNCVERVKKTNCFSGKHKE